MRVVYLNPTGQLGGAETSLRELLASIRSIAPQWELFLILGQDGPLAEEARQRGVQVMVEPFPPALARLGDAQTSRLALTGGLLKAALATSRYRRRLARLLKSLKPEIIHTNGFKMHLLGAWTRPQGTPLIWHIHDYVSSRRLMKHLLRVFGKACTLAIVNSHSVASDLGSRVPGLNMVPIYNAIDLKRFSPNGRNLNLDLMSGLSPAAAGTVRVGLVATFARWKGHKVFLRALAGLSTNIPIRGYVIGAPIYQTDGSQWSEQELKEEVDRLGLSGRVGFTGFVRDTAEAMRSLDIVVHASTEPEPFGMVIIEGMACGKAVIAAQAGGAKELFVHDENALGHRPGDVAGLTQQIQRLISDETLRHRLGAAARASSERIYSSDRLASELLAAYKQASASGVFGRPGVHLESEAEMIASASPYSRNN